jgi:hypothetical protein
VLADTEGESKTVIFKINEKPEPEKELAASS